MSKFDEATNEKMTQNWLVKEVCMNLVSMIEKCMRGQLVSKFNNRR